MSNLLCPSFENSTYSTVARVTLDIIGRRVVHLFWYVNTGRFLLGLNYKEIPTVLLPYIMEFIVWYQPSTLTTFRFSLKEKLIIRPNHIAWDVVSMTSITNVPMFTINSACSSLLGHPLPYHLMLSLPCVSPYCAMFYQHFYWSNRAHWRSRSKRALDENRMHLHPV
jgi:hypothetical protein